MDPHRHSGWASHLRNTCMVRLEHVELVLCLLCFMLVSVFAYTCIFCTHRERMKTNSLHSGLVGPPTVCGSGNPCVHQLESQMLHFCSSSLLMCLGKQSMLQLLGLLYPHGRQVGCTCLGLVPSKWNISPSSLCVCVSLSFK